MGGISSRLPSVACSCNLDGKRLAVQALTMQLSAELLFPCPNLGDEPEMEQVHTLWLDFCLNVQKRPPTEVSKLAHRAHKNYRR